MGIWDSYRSRLSAHGSTIRDVRLNRERGFLERKLPSHLSYHSALIDGAERQVAVINSDNLNQKTIYSMPGEEIFCGSMVQWEDNHWLVTEADANNEIYTKAIMLQCNYLLRWIADDGKIVERWCIIDDGTKYLTGETVSSYNENGMVLGDTRMTMTIARDEYTVQFTRDNRFLIDDYDSHTVLAYRLSKPFKIGGVYNGHGAIRFVLVEVNTEKDDNFELHIADYYKHFPRKTDPRPVEPGEAETPGGKRVWI